MAKPDEKYRSGDRFEYKDGREGVIVRPGGARVIVVRFDGETKFRLVNVENLVKP